MSSHCTRWEAMISLRNGVLLQTRTSHGNIVFFQSMPLTSRTVVQHPRIRAITVCVVTLFDTRSLHKVRTRRATSVCRPPVIIFPETVATRGILCDSRLAERGTHSTTRREPRLEMGQTDQITCGTRCWTAWCMSSWGPRSWKTLRKLLLAELH